MSKGGQRVDILHALHILWRVNTRPCVTWQKERTAKRVHIGEGRREWEKGEEWRRGKGSPGKWSKVELFEIGRWRGRLSEGILKNRTRTTVKIMES